MAMSKDRTIPVEDAFGKMQSYIGIFETWATLDSIGYVREDNAKKDFKGLIDMIGEPDEIIAYNKKEKPFTYILDLGMHANFLVFFEIINNVDRFYAEFLKCAKVVASHIEEINMDKAHLMKIVFNMGIIKASIDKYKKDDENSVKRKIYTEVNIVEPVTEGLSDYLFGENA